MRRIWFIAGIISIGVVSYSCNKKSVVPVEPGEYGIIKDTLYVPNSTIYFNGNSFNDKVSLPKGKIALVVHEGKSYLVYNDGNEVIDRLTDTVTAISFLKKVFKVYEVNSRNSYHVNSGLDLGDLGRCWTFYGDAHFDYEFSTGIGMNSIDSDQNRFEFTNCKVRTAAVEGTNDYVYLKPKEHLNIPGLFSTIFSTNDAETLYVANMVKTYGSIMRLYFLSQEAYYAIFYLNEEFRNSVSEAYNSNPDLFERLQLIDLSVAIADILIDIVGVAGILPGGDCFTTFTTPLIHTVELLIVGTIDREASNILHSIVIDLLDNFSEDLTSCICEAASAGVCGVVNSVLDLSDIVDLLYQTAISGFDVTTSLAFDKKVLGNFKYRFTLTWGEHPRDLDIHLWTPPINGYSYHVYFANRGAINSPPYANLDVDDIDSYGPENMTIYRLFNGTYTIAVHHYCYWGDDSLNIALSNARVSIYDSTGSVVTTLEVPNDSAGKCWWWHIATLDGSTGQLNIINSLSPDPPQGVSTFTLPQKTNIYTK